MLQTCRRFSSMRQRRLRRRTGRNATGGFEIEVETAVYYVNACRLEPILRTVNMEDYSSLQYFQRVLRSSGIIDALEEKGIQEGDTVDILALNLTSCRNEVRV